MLDHLSLIFTKRECSAQQQILGFFQKTINYIDSNILNFNILKKYNLLKTRRLLIIGALGQT